MSPAPSPHPRDVPGPRATTSLTATFAKNEFGKVLERVIAGERVVITRHDAPKAVILSFEEFNALADAAGPALDTLSAEFDALLARMQTAKARAGRRTAFGAPPAQLGKAALKAAAGAEASARPARRRA